MKYSWNDFKESFGTEDSIIKLSELMAKSKLSGNSLFREFFANDTASTLVPAQFMSQIMIGAKQNLMFRSFAPVISKATGESITVRRVDDTIGAQLVEEGAEPLIDQGVWEKEVYTYNKIAKRPQWSYEALADTPIDLIGINNQLMGALVSAMEDQIAFCDLKKFMDDLAAAADYQTAPVAGKTYKENLIDGIVNLAGRNRFYKADTILMSPTNYKLLLKDTNLPDASYFGVPEINVTGELARIFGCKIIVGNVVKFAADGFTPESDDDYTYILDSRFAVGIVERQPITIDSFDIPARQIANAIIYLRSILVPMQYKAINILTSPTA
ncbi:MAG: phage major capsid protein [Nanoarchaeota archaeon]|nr:phage major capsid protein [Nanoarchaeota archaeon]